MSRFIQRLSRRKGIEQQQPENTESKLSRCLNVVDLTALGIGSTLGLGLYVLTGQVAATYSGPAVVVAWIIAAVASAFSGVCYAEFGARVPTAGSAYVYSYVTVGEFIAFVIGWNMILEYVIGTAGVASGYSAYLNSLFDNYVDIKLRDALPINVPGLNTFPDFLSLGLVAVVTVLLSVGVKESTRFNNVCTAFNLLIVAYVVICGLFKVSGKNWSIPKADIPNDVPKGGGEGGFAPFGFAGIMAGAAKCFFGFVGFDIVATTGEEVKNPKKAIPFAFCASLIIIFISYVSVATIQTLVQPYYLQDNAYALPYVFLLSGYPVARWIISIGALAGLSTSILGAMFPLPRVVYAMATDGVIFRFLGKIHPKTRTPLIATILSGVLAAFMATMFNLTELVDMMSIGTLMAYTLVGAAVLLLRYRYEDENSPKAKFKLKDYIRQCINSDKITSPNELSSRLSAYLIIAVGIFSIFLSIIPAFFIKYLSSGHWWAITVVTISALCLITSIIMLKLQPQESPNLSFEVPWVPIFPCLGIFVNVYLMMSLSAATWLRFAVWMVIGLVIYFGYGISHSSEERQTRKSLQTNFPTYSNNRDASQGSKNDASQRSKSDTNKISQANIDKF